MGTGHCSVFQGYEEMTDEDVAGLARAGDNDAVEYLLVKYKKLVSLRSNSYFLIGGNREDVIQEGMIGLYKAILDFRPEKLSSFRAFADLCLRRQIITSIKAATRFKHVFLNYYTSLDRPIFGDGIGRTLMDVFPVEGTSNPEDLLIRQEELEEMAELMGKILTDFEWEVLMDFLDENSYREIAENLDCHVKAVDNALQRVKKKLRSSNEAMQ